MVSAHQTLLTVSLLKIDSDTIITPPFHYLNNAHRLVKRLKLCAVDSGISNSNASRNLICIVPMTLQSNLVCALVLTLSIVAILCCHGISAQTINPVQTFATGARRVVVDGDYLITAHVDVQVWTNNIDTGTKIMDITTGYTEPISVMTAIGGFLYAATSNGPRSIRKWNFITGIEIWRAPDVGNSHDDTLTGMAVSGTGMYTSSADGTIKLWNLNNGGFVNMVQGATGPSGFFAPIRNLIFDGATNQLFAGFGSYKASDGVGRATFVPTGDFEGIGTSDTISNWNTYFGMTRVNFIIFELICVNTQVRGRPAQA